MNKIREVERYILDEYQTMPQIIEYGRSPLTLFTLLTVKEFSVLGVTLGEIHQEHSQGPIMAFSYSGASPECRGMIVLPHALVHTQGIPGTFQSILLEQESG